MLDLLQNILIDSGKVHGGQRAEGMMVEDSGDNI